MEVVVVVVVQEINIRGGTTTRYSRAKGEACVAGAVIWRCNCGVLCVRRYMRPYMFQKAYSNIIGDYLLSIDQLQTKNPFIYLFISMADCSSLLFSPLFLP